MKISSKLGKEVQKREKKKIVERVDGGALALGRLIEFQKIIRILCLARRTRNTAECSVKKIKSKSANDIRYNPLTRKTASLDCA